MSSSDESSPLQVCDHELSVRLKHPNWRELLDNELLLCSSATVKLTRKTRDLNLKRESAKLLSQLSQLSFEELEGKYSVVKVNEMNSLSVITSIFFSLGSSLKGNFHTCQPLIFFDFNRV